LIIRRVCSVIINNTMFRGCFTPNEDQSPLSSGIPTFSTAKDALTFCELLDESSPLGSNPDWPGLLQCITTFIGWKQIQQYLIPRILQPMTYNSRQISLINNRFLPNKNTIQGTLLIEEQIKKSRLNLLFHSRLSPVSTMNTLRYAFFHMRNGILIQIRNQQIYTFAPFVNDQYINTWSHHLRMDPPNLVEYYQEKRKHYGRDEDIIPIENWWANGNIICNEFDINERNHTNQWWGDALLLPLRHLLETLCKEREIPDCDFFYNKRDHPQLRKDQTEPYDFLFDTKGVALPQHVKFSVMTPFVSFYCSNNFADLPIPTTEEWKAAVGQVIPDTTMEFKNEPSDLYLETNLRKFFVDWKDKINTAFFRGAATGGGVTVEDNQRLALAALCVKWKEQKGNNSDLLLDAGITKWNVRDKKMFGKPMTFLRAKTPEVQRLSGDYVQMYKQGKFKYLIYVQGHCAANRYAFLMRLGSVILRVQSTCEASELWFFPLLQAQDCTATTETLTPPGADHISIAADLSDLEEKILWCRQHDEICQQIAKNALFKYEQFIGREAILDYWQMLLVEIGNKFSNFTIPNWMNLTSTNHFIHGNVIVPPHLPHGLGCNNTTHEDCVRCRVKREKLGNSNNLATSSSASSSSINNAAAPVCRRCRRVVCKCT
jgi:hypothetical protein